MLSKLAYQIELNAAIGLNKYVNKYYGMEPRKAKSVWECE